MTLGRTISRRKAAGPEGVWSRRETVSVSEDFFGTSVRD
jgi:hypothetical protein